MKQANNVLFDDPPAWFFNYNKAVLAYHPWVKGLKPVAIELMFQDMTEVWVDEQFAAGQAEIAAICPSA